MPPAKGALWEFFLAGSKQNGSHVCAHCLGCLETKRPAGSTIDLDDEGNPKLTSESWVIDACNEDVGGVLGVKKSMIAHILGPHGNKPCPNSSEAARKVARKARENTDGGGKKRERDPSSDEEGSGEKKKVKRKALARVEKNMKQTQLKLFRGIQVPFNEEQMKIVQEQFLRATISANLPFRWVEDPEVVALFLLFRSTAGLVIPSRQQVSGELLDKANSEVMKRVKAVLDGRYAVLASDGWKDESKDSVSGVNLTVGGKTYLIDLILATAHKKDGESMCNAFEGMIDKAEQLYGVVVVGFCCDNDGGSQRGRKDLVLRHPWLFGPPCCAHQFQLVLGEYFTVNVDAAKTAEQATDLIGWVLNHARVRSIFNEVQATSPSGKVLAFLVANMTRWTTHFIAFDRLGDLKDSLRRAVLLRKDEIISAQVGAEKNRQKREKLQQDAETHCDLIDDRGFWDRLTLIVDDLEPICFGLNMNQTDAMRPDQALLTFVGIFLYFQKHVNPVVAAGMTKRIEKRWKALDQPMFVLALVLNPYQGVSRFGNRADISPFTLSTIFNETYRRVRSRPPKTPRSEDQEKEYNVTKQCKEREASAAFMNYLTSKGAFEHWENNKENFRSVNGDNPILVWEALSTTSAVSELADFAILLLGICVNQAGLERNFSDLKIKKTRLRNRLKLPKLEKMAKVGADIRSSQKDAGLVDERVKRTNHDQSKLTTLLEVPRYADLLEDGEDSSGGEAESTAEEATKPKIVKSRAAWRKEMAKWIREEQERDSDDEDEIANVTYGRKRSKWLPKTLEILFAGQTESDVNEKEKRRQRRNAYSEEARLMELLVDEEMDEDKILDDGEREGSGDDFEG
ncbi:hypothetical protein BDN72DRAFT_781827 [Pluteus cervinus]|uniref:Uncharacterized protein n=1 Tax=Pluteus cervinus TaxID=181527 RepID=A0ACD2ZZR8_9AGAR|nr:hypothetical protein BDN72DRAFT_781827 [Pluteus cervinus]